MSTGSNDLLQWVAGLQQQQHKLFTLEGDGVRLLELIHVPEPKSQDGRKEGEYTCGIPSEG